MITTPQAWTPAADHELRDLVQRGIAAVEIAKLTGRSLASIKSRKVKIQALARPVDLYWTDAAIHELRTHVANGLSSRQIAELMQRTATSIKTKRARLGLETPAGYQMRGKQADRPKPVVVPPQPKPPVTPRERQQRLTTVIVRIVASVPLAAVLGDVVRVAGRELVTIAYSPDGELVAVDAVTREVVVVAEATA